MVSHPNAAEAIAKANISAGQIIGVTASFICAHCSAFAQHQWGILTSLNVRRSQNVGGGSRVIGEGGFNFAHCSACNRETLFKDRTIIYPKSRTAPPPAPDMPDAIKDDYEEAAAIVQDSPRGAAALLRLAIQKLCPLIGAKEDDINKMIGQLVADGKVPAAVQQALDAVRVIGNEAVHPGTMNLKDDPATARSLFALVNFIVEKAIAEPKHVNEIFNGLPPGKRAGIAQRGAKGGVNEAE